ncbi:hypothetical protein INR49_008401, partial [Caranx melampygus]
MFVVQHGVSPPSQSARSVSPRWSAGSPASCRDFRVVTCSCCCLVRSCIHVPSSIIHHPSEHFLLDSCEVSRDCSQIPRSKDSQCEPGGEPHRTTGIELYLGPTTWWRISPVLSVMTIERDLSQSRAVDQSTCRWDLIQIPNPKRFGGEPEQTSDSDGAVHGVASCGTHSEELQTSSHFTNLLKHVRSSCQERPCQPERFPRKPTAEAKQMNHKRRCRRRVPQFVQTCYHGVGGWMISINISCRAVVPLQ